VLLLWRCDRHRRRATDKRAVNVLGNASSKPGPRDALTCAADAAAAWLKRMAIIANRKAVAALRITIGSA
jgi:hypothetical protein